MKKKTRPSFLDAEETYWQTINRALSGRFLEANMLNCLLTKSKMTTFANNRTPGLFRVAKLGPFFCALALAALVAGCASQSSGTPHAAPPPQASAGDSTAQAPASPKSLILQEGDTIKLSFPGAPNLDNIEVVRRDGKITLPMVGEYDAAGKTPVQVEDELKKLYASQLVNNSLNVTVQSSAFIVYVMGPAGAVSKPGKIISDRPLTPLQALIEAGVDDSRANLKAVQVIRTDANGRTEKFKLNLRDVLRNPNAQMPDFTLKPYDTIYVGERFSWY